MHTLVMREPVTSAPGGSSGHAPVAPAVVDPRVLDRAFRTCVEIARHHYENFPVASLFIPASLRPHIATVYAFARAADDIADEGTLDAAERLRGLDAWEEQLDACLAGRAEHPVFIALAETVRLYAIPRKPLADLLAAFRMDVTKKTYATFEELLQYCELSANPVGRLVLTIFGNADTERMLLSDRICTGLQLTNFWQDVAVDRAKGRVYIPLEDFESFGYTVADLTNSVVDQRFRAMMQKQVERTAAFFAAGKPLLDAVTRDLRFELVLTLNGGMAILDKIERNGFDVLSRRPKLSPFDKMSLLLRSLMGRTR